MLPDMSGMMVVMMALFFLIPLLVIVVIAALVVWAIRSQGVPAQSESGEAPLIILQRRYARGDIGAEEYERLRATLTKS